jgi:hypothetical protein
MLQFGNYDYQILVILVTTITKMFIIW